jgi:hypothetical protein
MWQASNLIPRRDFRARPFSRQEEYEMTIRRIWGALAGGAIFAVAGVAAAGDFGSGAKGDFFAAGTHQFYVWCGAAGSYTATANGRDAEDAQLRLYDSVKSSGREHCWPVWQGRLRE